MKPPERGGLAAVALALLFAARPVAAEPGGALDATLRCDRAPAVGRVRCEISVHPKEGALRWVDAQIIKVPAKVVAPRARLAPGDGIEHETGDRRFVFALVAREPVSDDVEVRVRAVVCLAADAGSPRCTAAEVTTTTRLVVGPDAGR